MSVVHALSSSAERPPWKRALWGGGKEKLLLLSANCADSTDLLLEQDALQRGSVALGPNADHEKRRRATLLEGSTEAWGWKASCPTWVADRSRAQS